MTDEASAPFQTRNWLYHPQFPEHWEPRPLYSLAEWVNGLAFRDIQFSPTGAPVIKIAEIKDGISSQTKFTQQSFDEAVRVRRGDLLFSWSGQPETSIDAFWWQGPDGWLNQHVFRVTPAQGIDQTFFYYLLRYLKPSFVGIARNKQTTGLGHVTKRDLEDIEAAYPPMPEQKAIAHIVGTLDMKIELNRHTTQTLHAMARALFKSWFVDFDPVRAKAAGKMPWGMDEETAALFPDSFEDSELGQIPMGWRVLPLEQVAWFTKGVSYRSNDLAESDTALVSLKCAGRKGEYREDGLKPYRGDFKPHQVLQPGDVVVSHTDVTQHADVIGRALRVRPVRRFSRLVASLDMTVVRPRDHGLSREFLFQSLSQERFRNHAYGYTNGTTVLHLSSRALPEYPYLAPTSALTQEFSRLIAPNDRLVDLSGIEGDTLAALRDALLPKLFSGEVRVPVNRITLGAPS